MSSSSGERCVAWMRLVAHLCCVFSVVGGVAGCGGDEFDAQGPPAGAGLPAGPAGSVAVPASAADGVEPTAAGVPAAARPPLAPAPASRVETVGPYQADVGRDCDGYPRISLATLPGMCVGLVTTAAHPAIAAAGPRFRPRSIVQDPARDDVFWVIDAGAQREHAGRVFRVRLPGEPGAGAVSTPVVQLVATGLNRPHGGRLGPDGKLYVGEVDGVFRFDPGAANQALDTPEHLQATPGRAALVSVAREPVVTGLATQLRREDRIRYHPMSAFVFTPAGDIVLNRGSSTDRCLESLPAARCEDEADDLAALVLYRHLGDGRYADTPEVLARGLRNSVALVAHRSGTILQGENGSDFSEADRPHEELNEIVRGGHYGWPYCFDRAGRDPSWTHSDFTCDPASNTGYRAPLLLLPPHGAPLGLAYYDHDVLPGLRRTLLVSLHGYRATGHRLLVFPVDARGMPTAVEPTAELIGGWDASELGPKGAPVELAVARDGSVWLVEDKNGTVLRVAPERYVSVSGGATTPSDVGRVDDPATLAAFETLRAAVLAPRCGPCHAFLQQGEAALRTLRVEGWLAADGDSTQLERRVRREHERPMPPAAPLPADELARVLAWVATAR